MYYDMKYFDNTIENYNVLGKDIETCLIIININIIYIIILYLHLVSIIINFSGCLFFFSDFFIVFFTGLFPWTLILMFSNSNRTLNKYYYDYSIIQLYNYILIGNNILYEINGTFVPINRL